MMRKWTKILPFFIIEKWIMNVNPQLEYVKVGNLDKRMSYVYPIYPDMIFVRDTEAIKKARLKTLKEKVAKLEFELEEN